MAFPNQTDLGNRLLRAMAPDDFAILKPKLRVAAFTLGHVVIEPDRPVKRVLFPVSGFVSVVTQGPRMVEVGLIGREGAAGATPLVLGSSSTPFRYTVQYPGEMVEIEAAALTEAADRSPSLRRLLLRFVQVFLTQTTQTAGVNAVFDLEARLARWLLMCRDRVDSDELHLTHEFLAMMLGVQRTSITLALQTIEGDGAVRARRGRIEIRDRALLERTAGDGYGLPEAEYARLFEET